MTSMGSLPFFVDKTSILLHNKKNSPPLSYFSAHRKSSYNFGGSNNLTIGPFKDFPNCKIKYLKATGKESGEAEDGEYSGDAVQAAIKKSQKLLAVQRDLIQQIAERRKLVSSINNEVIDAETDDDPLENRDGSSSSLDSGKGDFADTFEERYTPDFLTGSRHKVSPDGSQEDQPSTISDDLHEDAEQNGKSFYFEQSIATPSKKESLSELPPFLSASDTSTVKNENYEYVEEPGHEAQDEFVKAPPLAGANVMNVILVAAECAPWSKTGGLGDVAGALPKALARRGHRVMVVAPLYGNYAEPQNTGIRKLYKVDGQDMEVTYFHAYIDGVDFVFIESPKFRHIENNIYGGNRTVRYFDNS